MVNVKRKVPESQRYINSYYVANPEAAWKSVHYNLAWFQMIFIGWDEMRNSIYVMGKDIPVSGYHGSPDRIFVVFPCMLSQHTRRIRERYRGVTSRSWPGSRPWYLANIWSDPGQIRGTVTSWWKAWNIAILIDKFDLKFVFAKTSFGQIFINKKFNGFWHNWN